MERELAMAGVGSAQETRDTANDVFEANIFVCLQDENKVQDGPKKTRE